MLLYPSFLDLIKLFVDIPVKPVKGYVVDFYWVEAKLMPVDALVVLPYRL